MKEVEILSFTWFFETLTKVIIIELTTMGLFGLVQGPVNAFHCSCPYCLSTMIN